MPWEISMGGGRRCGARKRSPDADGANQERRCDPYSEYVAKHTIAHCQPQDGIEDLTRGFS
jgi:hypothetical protein